MTSMTMNKKLLLARLIRAVFLFAPLIVVIVLTVVDWFGQRLYSPYVLGIGIFVLVNLILSTVWTVAEEYIKQHDDHK